MEGKKGGQLGASTEVYVKSKWSWAPIVKFNENINHHNGDSNNDAIQFHTVL